MKNLKLKSEELKQIKEIQARMKAVQEELGLLELQKLELEQRKENAFTYLKETRKMEEDLAKILQHTYGEGTIDLNKEEFIPAPTKDELPS